MPRRQFVADLQKAQSDVKPTGVLDIRAGEDDGQFEFEVATPALDGAPSIPIKITAMIPDVSEYPKSHDYMIFCNDDAPPHVGQALQNVRNTERKTVFELIDIISAMLSSLVPDADGDTPMQDSVFDEDLFEDEDGDDVYGDDDDSFSFGAPVVTRETAHVPSASQAAQAGGAGGRAFRERLRSDLRAAKDAGFKVGHLGHLIDGYAAYVTMSVRMSKLGISEEAMQAWQVEPSDYLILIIQYPNGYKTNEQLQAYDSIRLKPNIGMRVYAGKHYKPSLQEAIAAFTKARKDRGSTGGDDSPAKQQSTGSSSIRETFVSKPLVSLLEDNLVPVLRFRSTGMDWSGAEAWYNEVQGAVANNNPMAVPDKYYEPEDVNTALPEIATSDQYKEGNTTQYSFPLLAMQFLLRHFVRCTEFCTVCHRHMASELEAIKPYVCERPLCLFQYMAMGFGPSIEHEIMAQPYVVDLLISFCYSSALTRKLKEFPDGLAMMVPPSNTPDMTLPAYNSNGVPAPKKTTSESWDKATEYEIGFDAERREVIFFDKPTGGCPVARGAWIVIRQSDSSATGPPDELHCRVSETTFFPTITVDPPVLVSPAQRTTVDLQPQDTTAKAGKPVTPVATPKWVSAKFTTYDQDFEQLNKNDKCAAICKLLDTLPTVKAMQEYLRDSHSADLKAWTDRLSPAAVSLLRWIIASNRACIMQVDGDSEATADGAYNKKTERLSGMKDHLQFRFAMGAPDKEQRFMSAVRATKDRLNLKYPTLFAWHGSPLHNWHMIIREGLHFRNTDHGRAYGHGVYHAKDAQTSTGYSGMYYGGGAVNGPTNWPNSVLRVTSALALNEIVNAPAEFVSNNPYYVVAQLDWIQTRYLFVQCSPTNESVKPGDDKTPVNAHPQDPTHTPRGMSSQAIVIPASAIKSGRPGKERGETPVKEAEKRNSGWFGGSSKKNSKKQKGNSGDPILIDGDDVDNDDAASVDTEPEDLTILFDDEPAPEPAGQKLPVISKTASKKPAGPTTDFVPGSLDFSTLPMMPMPTYAVSSTTKALMNELKNLAKIQSTSNPADLGWYIDVEKIDNVYQWIVELHSFHTFEVKGKPLPLVADMKKRDVKSIVLEIRFGPDYPFSPPYIRVVRPRFLPFTQGGGGHIVIGGAMCMELLTNTGWNSVLPMDSVLMQVRLAIASEPFARLEGGGAGSGRSDYGAGEAADGYLRACASHGWKVPPGFQQIAHGMRSDDTV